MACYGFLTYLSFHQSYSCANLSAMFLEILINFGIENKVRSDAAVKIELT